MEQILSIIIITFLAGLAMPLGAILSLAENIRPNWLVAEFRHGVLAFGGGALLSAIALVLIPESLPHLSPFMAAFAFISGGGAFMALDIFLSRKKTHASQLAAMLSDYIPESIALGAAFTNNAAGGYLLALLIGLQNFPEGFNAYRELTRSPKFRPIKALILLGGMALLGPLAATIGYFWLADKHVILSFIMLFAAGGILYSVFQDIAPGVKLAKHYAPPMGAVLGFVLGLLGFMLTH